MTTHISYETAKRLKEFLGEAAPEPMEENPKAYYGKDLLCYAHDEKDTSAHKYTFDGFAYQLHDLLSKEFCEALAKRIEASKEPSYVSTAIFWAYYIGGMPQVEAVLMKMMKGGK